MAESRWLRAAYVVTTILCGSGAAGCLKTADRYAQSTLDVDVNPPATFEVQGQPFCFAGANNYYLAYKPKPMVDDALTAARDLGFPVMRMWGFIDIGSLDNSVKAIDADGGGKKDGVYFQYWDPQHRRPAYNEGDDGLRHLDYALAKASELGVRIILVLTNNWRDFGGMDQYLRWYGRTKHHEFYTDPEVKQAFKSWVSYLINRVNTVNGRTYRDDPTIFSWELANEPRCKGTGPGAPGWTNDTLPTWVDEVSAYIKSLDRNHMVSVGDEGFLASGGEHWAYKANDGVDHEKITAVPGVDFGTFHMYPEDWGASLDWGKRWIVEHERVARRLGKPTVLEEYGVKVTRDDGGLITSGLDQRLRYYQLWNDSVLRRGGNASMAWILAGVEQNGALYKDYDHYTFYRGDETSQMLSAFARRFVTEAPACMKARQDQPGAPTPFVRTRRPPQHVASVLGWGLEDG
jgi:mannan endo-1,4-beta-mannosidase